MYVYSGLGTEFIGMFTELWKAAAGLIMSVHLSVCPHETVWSPRDGFLQKFILGFFLLTAMWEENSDLVKTGQM